LFDISFLLATNRPYWQFAKPMVDSVVELHKSSELRYEILLCTKEKVDDHRLKLIEEPLVNEGSVLPFNLLNEYACGRYIAVLNDDFILLNKLDPLIDQMVGREHRILCMCPEAWDDPENPENYGKIMFGGDTANIPFPVISREFIAEFLEGYLFHPRFQHHYSDCWLAFYLSKHFAFRNLLCKEVKMRPTHDLHRHHEHDQSDFEVYRELTNRQEKKYV
jgi:hypothetical protein